MPSTVEPNLYCLVLRCPSTLEVRWQRLAMMIPAPCDCVDSSGFLLRQVSQYTVCFSVTGAGPELWAGDCKGGGPGVSEVGQHLAAEATPCAQQGLSRKQARSSSRQEAVY